MSYPNNSIKGIPNYGNFFYEDGSIASHLFDFKDRRDDGWVEQSINWEDNESVIDFTLNQRRSDSELHFRGGVAIVPRSGIDRLNRRPTIEGLLTYERKPLDDNPYHGNLLLRADVPKKTMRKIAAGLALEVSRIVPQRQNGASENER